MGFMKFIDKVLGSKKEVPRVPEQSRRPTEEQPKKKAAEPVKSRQHKATKAKRNGAKEKRKRQLARAAKQVNRRLAA